MKLRKTMRFSTGTKLKLTIDATGQILYPATMIGIVSYFTTSARARPQRPVLLLSQEGRHARALTVFTVSPIWPVPWPFMSPIRTRKATVLASAPTVMQSTNHLARVLRMLSFSLL